MWPSYLQGGWRGGRTARRSSALTKLRHDTAAFKLADKLQQQVHLQLNLVKIMHLKISPDFFIVSQITNGTQMTLLLL
jgi:hypothetical protein